MALTEAQFAKVVKELILSGMPDNAAAILEAHLAREKQKQQHFRELFVEGSSEITLDTDRTSLQWRILKYLKKKSWISDPEADLKKAWESAKQANAQQGVSAYLGGQGKEKAPTKDLRAIFPEIEQWLCYQAAAEGVFTPPFTLEDFLALAKKSFVAGQGTALIGFLGRLRLNHEKSGGHGKFNPNKLIMSLMWVFPSVPFWLLPSRAIAEFIRVALDEETAATAETINNAIRTAGLVRIPETVLDDFYSSSADAKGKALLAEITKQALFDVSTCFAGRRRGS